MRGNLGGERSESKNGPETQRVILSRTLSDRYKSTNCTYGFTNVSVLRGARRGSRSMLKELKSGIWWTYPALQCRNDIGRRACSFGWKRLSSPAEIFTSADFIEDVLATILEANPDYGKARDKKYQGRSAEVYQALACSV